MVFRTLARLSGGQPSPQPFLRMPYMKRSERKGHYAYQLLWGANFVGGVVCTAFCLRYLLVRDRGLIVHFERKETGNDEKGTPLQVFEYPHDKYKIPNRPDIGVFQPLKEAGSIHVDH